MWYLVYTCRFRDCTCTLVDDHEQADSGALALKCVLVLVRKFLLHLLTPSLSGFLGLHRTAGTFGIAFGSCVFCCRISLGLVMIPHHFSLFLSFLAVAIGCDRVKFCAI